MRTSASPSMLAGAAVLAATLATGCVDDPPYLSVFHGQVVAWDFLTPACTSFDACEMEVEVVNSCRQTVRVLVREQALGAGGDYRAVVWDTRDDEDRLVPEDMYVLKASISGRVFDSIVVFVHD